MSKPAQTRREAQRLTPEIMGKYHALVMNADFEGLEKLFDLYGIEEGEREALRADFTRYAEQALRWRWRPK